jgi:hypothetical protein
MRTKRAVAITAMLVLSPCALLAQESDEATIKVDGFLDTYFAYGFNRPFDRIRQFATSPARFNEFAVNLALIRAQYANQRVRASFGWATGTYMEANYVVEPQILQNIYEAYVGANLGNDVWLDVGVFPSHVGFESAISIVNPTYTRSLFAEFSPYFETGVRLTVPTTDKFAITFLALNGWQNIRETNNAKAGGLQFQYRVTDNVLLNYSSFLGNEAFDDSGELDPDPQLRFFHDFYVQAGIGDKFDLWALFDIGTQELPGDDATWYTGGIIGRYEVNDRWAFSLRGELYSDPDEAIVITPPGDGFEVAGGSFGVDYRLFQNALARIEVGVQGADEAIWFARPLNELKTSSGYVVGSMAIAF